MLEEWKQTREALVMIMNPFFPETVSRPGGPRDAQQIQPSPTPTSRKEEAPVQAPPEPRVALLSPDDLPTHSPGEVRPEQKSQPIMPRMRIRPDTERLGSRYLPLRLDPDPRSRELRALRPDDICDPTGRKAMYHRNGVGYEDWVQIVCRGRVGWVRRLFVSEYFE
jgi:hypothetical protein